MDILKEKNAVLDIGQKLLILLEHGQKLEYVIPPGATVTPLQTAPSGHLCMILDDFENLNKKTGGLTQPPLDLAGSEVATKPTIGSSQMASH